MKKRNQSTKVDNVIQFPELEKRLLKKGLPKEKLDHFYRMLHFSQQRIDDQSEYDIISISSMETNRKLPLFQCQDAQEEMMLAAKLSHLNIQPYIQEITAYLQSDEGTPFFKTLLLNVLKEHQHDKPIQVQKFGKGITVIPAKLLEMDENPQLVEIIDLIGLRLENDDPVLFEHIKSLIKRQIFLIYPFDLEPGDIPVWAAAYHALGNEYYGEYDTRSELSEVYQVLQTDIEKADSFIRMIEEISYLNI